MTLTWLAAELRAAGLDVWESPGWETRQTRDGFDPQGVVCHHTATSSAWADGHVYYLLRDGRRDLAGPLAQIGIERDGTVVLVAAGRCNHNGYGEWGNDSVGIEAYNDGVGEPWPEAQLDAYRRTCAVICRHFGWSSDRVKAHRETDPSRKVDPAGIDMTRFRTAVTALTLTAHQENNDDMSATAEAQIHRIATVLGVATDIPDGLSKNAAERVDKMFEKLGAGRDGLSGNALARIDRIWSEAVGDDVDEAAVVAAVLAGLTPEVIAAAIPTDLAERVADELAARLAG